MVVSDKAWIERAKTYKVVPDRVEGRRSAETEEDGFWRGVSHSRQTMTRTDSRLGAGSAPSTPRASRAMAPLSSQTAVLICPN